MSTVVSEFWKGDPEVGRMHVVYLDAAGNAVADLDAIADWEAERAAERKDRQHRRMEALGGRFPLLDLEALLDPNRPPRQWFLEGFAPEGDHVSIVAPGGTGKSLFALGLAVAAVRGEATFAGQRISFPKGAKLLYVDMENSEDDWAERLRSLGLAPNEARWIWGVSFFPLSLPGLRGLDTKAGAEEFFAEVLDRYGITRGDVVVLDSTQRVTEGPENENDTIRKLYDHTSAELKRRGLTVIRTDNTGKDVSLGARGASAKRDDVAYSWLMEQVGTSDVFTLKNTKHRSAGSAGTLRFRRVTDDAGRLRFEPVIESAGAAVRSRNVRFQIAVTKVLRDRWEAALASEGIEPWLSQTGLKRQVRETEVDGQQVVVRNNEVHGLLTDLVEGGYLKSEPGPQSTIRYTWLRDYHGGAE